MRHAQVDTYTDDVPELHHDAAETVNNLFLDAGVEPDERTDETTGAEEDGPT